MKESVLMVKLGKRIRSLRLKKNMSQNDLASKCDFEKAGISRIESGLANPTLRTLYRISLALEVELADLFSD